MSSLKSRVITAAIAIPLIFCLIFCLPQYHHLAFAVLVFAASFLGSRELKNLLASQEETRVSFPFWVPSLLIPVAWIETYHPEVPLTDFALLSLAIIAFFLDIFPSGKEDFTHSLPRTGALALLLLYPSFFFTFLIKVSTMERSIPLLLLYFLLVFGNDTFAYCFGLLFGRNNRGVLKVSPNKSVAGFVGGSVSTIILSLLYCHFIDTGFSLLASLALGLVISLGANIGDLIESSFKRCAKVKDSGALIPGRGGLLDSIDSLLVAAPLFWVLCALWAR